MTDQNTPEAVEDDELPPVHFSLRNPSGDDGTVTIEQRLLGMSPYLLVTADEQEIKVDGSHISFDDAVGLLALIVGMALESDNLSDDVRQGARAFLAHEEEA